MKFFVISIFLLLNSTGRLMSESITTDLLDKVLNSFEERYQNPTSIKERKSFNDLENFQELEKHIASTWREDLTNLEEVAPDATRRALYFKAAESLPIKDYIDLAITSGQLVKAGKLDKQQFSWIVGPSEKHLRFMWYGDQYTDRINNLAITSREIFAGDGSKRDKFFEDVLSGDALEKERKFREKYGYDDIPEEERWRFNKGHPRQKKERVAAAKKEGTTTSWILWVGTALLCAAMLYWVIRLLSLPRLPKSLGASQRNIP